MNDSLQASIDRQRQLLQRWLSSSLNGLAGDCSRLWPDRDALEARLLEGLLELPYCKYLYVLDLGGRQVTANASRSGLLQAHFGRNRAGRPYLAAAFSGAAFSLSEAYLSRNSRRPSLTAVQAIVDAAGRRQGFLAADFDLRELPVTRSSYRQPGEWMQLRGDPAIRSGLFYQERVSSALDERIDTVLYLLEELVTVNGVFHLKVHFSRSRATLWSIDDPYRFRIHGIEDLTNPGLCLAYSHHRYPRDAELPSERVADVLEGFRKLRYMDETIYLRSGILNVFNGLVGLTFSCDGSHYMRWQEFLEKDVDFWLGRSTRPPACRTGAARNAAQAIEQPMAQAG